MSDDEPKIKVFASDDNLKSLGELLSNDSSRSIIYNLMTKEMYTNEISTTLDMRVSLVIHHLKKLEDLGLLEITEKKIKRKGIEHRFFKIKSNIFVVLDNTKEEIKEKGFLQRIFRDGIKFASVGIIGAASWFGTQTLQYKIYPPDVFYERPMIKIPQDIFYSIILTGIFVGVYIFLLVLKKKKKRC